jgi:hypothetical protein
MWNLVHPHFVNALGSLCSWYYPQVFFRWLRSALCAGVGGQYDKHEITIQAPMNEIAPEKQLRVGLRLLYRATTHCRNLALNAATPHKKIEDLMDAVHQIPEWLAQWERFSEQELLLFLGTYDDKWSGPEDGFSLSQTYLDLMKSGISY